MKSFIKNMTDDDEKVMFSAHLHWIYLFEGILWLVFMVVVGTAADYATWRYMPPIYGFDFLGRHIGSGMPFLTLFAGAGGVFIFLAHLLKYAATEIVLTTQRVIYKTGFIFVNVREIDLVEIRAENVHHGCLGRFLGYGEIHMDSRFVGDISLPAVRNPYQLVKAMHRLRMRTYDPMGGMVGLGHGERATPPC